MLRLRFSHLILVIACFLSIVLAIPAPKNVSEYQTVSRHQGNRRCLKVDRRKEWRDLSIKQRKQYLDAVLCLHSKLPLDPTRDATTRFEEFQLTHILLTDRIHFVGQFLPWHRHLTILYNKALRQECGYKGPSPYWDWTRDAESNQPLLQSPIFHPVTGFGGDGVPGTYALPPDPNGEAELGPFTPAELINIWRGCVRNGPFANSVFHLGPGKMKTPHCLVRGINEPLLQEWLSTARVQEALATQSYEEFRLLIDIDFYGIHGGGHGILGGEMTNGFSAPGDPLFYLHHANLDRVWWLWQEADPANRRYDISGPIVKFGTSLDPQVNLDFQLDFPSLGSNVTIRETMDASLEPNCFTYE
ncbi:Di-copper centre-containing protein [Coprinellus micaceus]|uniref:Di-copper centre-containing protein n=1 Tax=Coprinellus micaceus TaxID=71717 RepID=A0A4Y7T9K6_COPMI|nr:Di-copper centre-containing protein [Coprinellus micaceus]